VVAPSRVIAGRKLAGWALVEVGETSTVSRSGTRRLERPPRSGRHAALGHALPVEAAGERSRRVPPQSRDSGASSAMCSRMVARISARSASSAARRCTSATIEERIRRLAAASRRAATRAGVELVVQKHTISTPNRGSDGLDSEQLGEALVGFGQAALHARGEHAVALLGRVEQRGGGHLRALA
jgi:hypothetical protein